MANWAAKNKHDGRVLFVSDENYDPTDWDLVKLSRKPTVHDEFIDGKLVKNKGREDAAKKHEAANSLTRAELVDRIIALEKAVAILQDKP